MILNSKGQVTIPAQLRAKHHLREGDEVTVVEVDGKLQIVRVDDELTRGQRIVRRLRRAGTAEETAGMSTDELMELLRGD